MTDKNTPAVEPVTDTPATDSYEQRYKDAQATITKTAQENAILKSAAEKDKELLDAVTPYINYDAMNGIVKEPEDGDAVVDKKTLSQTVQELRNEINRTKYTTDFRTKFPDMIEHEDLVGLFLQKTNPRDTIENRMSKAVDSTKALLEAQRTKGREQYEQESKNKASKEAEAGGLGGGHGPQSEVPVEKGETNDEYIAYRKELAAKSQGIR